MPRRVLRNLSPKRNMDLILSAFGWDGDTKRKVAQEVAQSAELRTALRAVRDRVSEQCLSNEEAPIFLFAACWRSGSTLLQRMLMHSQEALIWGEPLAKCAIVPGLMDQLRPVSTSWPSDKDAIERLSGELSSKWVANLHPGLEALLNAHRDCICTLFQAPARSRGRMRWGLKEVRYGRDEALYLSLLFPKAKFIFLMRDPVATFRSFHSYITTDYRRWPTVPVSTPREFADLWCRLATEFQTAAEELGGLVVKYEHLLEDDSVSERIADYVGFAVPPARQVRWVHGRTATQKTAHYMPRLHRKLFVDRVRAVATRVGYDNLQ